MVKVGHMMGSDIDKTNNLVMFKLVIFFWSYSRKSNLMTNSEQLAFVSSIPFLLLVPRFRTSIHTHARLHILLAQGNSQCRLRIAVAMGKSKRHACTMTFGVGAIIGESDENPEIGGAPRRITAKSMDVGSPLHSKLPNPTS